MNILHVNRDQCFIMLEERWFRGQAEGDTVDVHARVYRIQGIDAGGQYGASAHVHKGGHLLRSSSGPRLARLSVADSREAAIDAALDRLECQYTGEDH